MDLVIIGGSDAGISAALRARELAPDTRVTVIVGDAYPNYSICGLPFYHSGEVTDWHTLAHRTTAMIEREGVRLLLDHTATTIDPTRKHVTVVPSRGGDEQTLAYDRLVIGTGAMPVLPPVAGLDLPGVFTLHTMGSSFAVEEYLVMHRPRSAVIIGAGYIGTEMADALTLRGLDVTLVGRAETVLPTVEPPLGRVLEAELRRHGVAVASRTAITAVTSNGAALTVTGTNGFARSADIVLVAVGVRANTALARTAAVATGTGGVMRVTRRMETNVPDIYAAGDCVETYHRLLDQYTYAPLGTTAHKQGRVAGENAVGGNREYAGSVGTQVVKIFALAAARTGLLHAEAEAAGFAPLTVASVANDHKAYYPGATSLHLRVTGDRETGRLLGAQIVGHWQSAVAKRVDVFAAALYHGMTVEAVNDLDLAYTPPLGSPWDAVQMAAQAWGDAWRRARVAPRVVAPAAPVTQ